MFRFAFLCLVPPVLFGGCVAFAPVAESRCVPQSPEWKWVGAPAGATVQKQSRTPYHPVMADAAFGTGVELGPGTQRFEFAAAGPHLVELMLWSPEADRYPFHLYVNGKQVDERPLIAPGPGRLRPKRNMRFTSMLAVVTGPASIELRTETPRYALSAARWTPMSRFEEEVAPVYLKAARESFRRVLSEKEQPNPVIRRAWMQHLYDRLWFSSDKAVRDEALIGRTRAWFWQAAENHEPDDILQTKVLFEEGLRTVPQDPILRQMISAGCIDQVSPSGRMPRGRFCDEVKPVKWTVDVPPAPRGAPDWAVAQRALTRRMDAITRWWVEQRQLPNGELGGGWGDDVEILRHWGPLALGLGSETAARGVLNVAGGLWNSGTLLHGYDKGISDVEHSSEPTTDTVPLTLALFPSDRELEARAATTAACSEYWIAPQPDGRLRFRSSWFNCREADTSGGRAVDVHLNTRAMGPALWHAYLSRDKALIARIAGWADSWIEAMRRTEHGKPRGLFPPALRSKDGHYVLGETWDKPDVEWDYFQWSGGSQEALTSLVLAVHDLTGDRKYLQAAAESFDILRNCSAEHQRYCSEIRKAPEAFYKWRAISDDSRFDAAFGYRTDPPAKQILSEMVGLAREAEERFSVNWDMMTSDVLYTDRVYYALPPEYRLRLFGGESPRGDRYPSFAVTWPAAKAEFARAVLSANAAGVRLQMYSFESEPRSVPVRFWRLAPGRYRWRLGTQSGNFEAKHLPHTLELPLPPKSEVEAVIERIQ
jgi:hypothetical protein